MFFFLEERKSLLLTNGGFVPQVCYFVSYLKDFLLPCKVRCLPRFSEHSQPCGRKELYLCRPSSVPGNTDLWGLTLELFMLGLCSVSDPCILAIWTHSSRPRLDTSRGHNISADKLEPGLQTAGLRMELRIVWQVSHRTQSSSCELSGFMWDRMLAEESTITISIN